MQGFKTFLTGETKENQELSLEFVGYQVLMVSNVFVLILGLDHIFNFNFVADDYTES